MRPRRRSPLRLAPFLLAFALAAAHAADVGKASKYYEDALARFEKNDTDGAVLQLKNALQQDPRMLAGYILLGKAHLKNADPAAAEDAFTKALHLGVSRAEVAIPMATALLQQSKFEALLERFPAELIAGPRRIEILILRSQAHRGMGDLKAAARALDEARTLDSRNVAALLAQADLLVKQERREEAAKRVDEAAALAPGEAKVWHLKAAIAHSSGDLQTALSAYEKTLSLDPSYVDARIGRASLALFLRQDAKALADLNYLKEQSPTEPRGLYLRAVYFSRLNDDAAVAQSLQALTRAVDTVPKETLQRRAPELLMLGALAHHGLKQSEKARSYLETLLRVNPRDAQARKLLGSIMIANGDYRNALIALEPARKEAGTDGQLLALIAAAHIGAGQFQRANTYLERALKLSGEASEVHATFGLSLLGSGRAELALEHLEQAFKKDPGQPRAGLALAVLRLKRGEAERAVEVAEAVISRHPHDVTALNLLGVARAAAGDRRGARTAYSKAISIDERFIPAQLNLARLTLLEGDGPAAGALLQATLKGAPKNAQAMAELASVEERAGRLDEAIRWLEKARAFDRRNVGTTIRLGDLYLARHDSEKALSVIKDGGAFDSENLELLACLARVQLALGNQKLALNTLTRMNRLAAFDPDWQTRIARYQLAANDASAAIYSLDKALTAKPDHLGAQALMVEVELKSGEVAKAAQRAKSIAQRIPASALGYQLVGDVEMARRNFDVAGASYRAAQQREPSTAGTVRVFRAYMAADDARRATEVMEAWLKSHPDDLAARRAVAEGYLRAGNLPLARSAYEQVLERQADDASALNNLAHILARMGDPKSLDIAERAFRAAPKDASIQDTLGWILVERSQLDSGLRHLREARLRSPDNSEIRYHLAAALARAGRREEARQEVEQALKGDSFESAEQARKLLRELATR